jgi:hypothetical protein
MIYDSLNSRSVAKQAATRPNVDRAQRCLTSLIELLIIIIVFFFGICDFRKVIKIIVR